MVNIGQSVVIKGELKGSEDLTVEGRVEGTIALNEHVLTIGANGNIQAKISAKSIIVLGTVVGNITASERVEIRDSGSVEGDIVSPRVAISEGARFLGSVDMSKRPQPGSSAPVSAPKSPPPSSSVGHVQETLVAASAAH